MTTLMLALGTPVHVVAARLGHANPGFTLKVYAGFIPGAQAEAAEKLAALLNGSRRQSLTPKGDDTKSAA